MSGFFNISLVKGEPFSSTVTTTIGTTNPLSLSGYYISGGIRYEYEKLNLVDFGINIHSDISGVFTFSLQPEETFKLPVTECLYYIKAIPSGNGGIIDLLNGYIRVYPL